MSRRGSRGLCAWIGSMEMPQLDGPRATQKLRLACDRCHDAKMRCTGGAICRACSEFGEECVYSLQQKAGRPKGARNKKTQPSTRSNPSTAGSSSVDFDTGDGSGGSLRPVLAPYDPLLPDASTREMADADAAELWYAFQHHPPLDFHHPPPPDNAATDALCLSRPSSRNWSGLHSVRTSAGPPIAPMNSRNSISMPSIASTWSPPSARSDFASAPPALMDPCNCLQQHADLLCALKSIERRSGPSPIEIALSSVKHALGPWQALVGCRMPQDNNNGALLLAGLSMRVVIQRFEAICAASECDMRSSNALPRRPSQYLLEKILIGNYEASCHEKRFVAELLVLRALEQIEATILALSDKLDAFPSTSQESSPNHRHSPSSQSLRDSVLVTSPNSEPGVLYVKELLQALASTVSSIDHTLRTRNATTLR